MIASFLLLAACGHDCPPGQGWADGMCVDLLDTGGLDTRGVCPDLDRAVPGQVLPDEFETCIDPLASGACPLRSELDERGILDALEYVDTGGCGLSLSIWCGPVTKAGKCCYSVNAYPDDCTKT